jgi:hypothetical protein
MEMLAVLRPVGGDVARDANPSAGNGAERPRVAQRHAVRRPIQPDDGGSAPTGRRRKQLDPSADNMDDVATFAQRLAMKEHNGDLDTDRRESEHVVAGDRRVIRESQPDSAEHRGGESAPKLREANHQIPRFGWALYGRTLGSSGMKNRHA